MEKIESIEDEVKKWKRRSDSWATSAIMASFVALASVVLSIVMGARLSDLRKLSASQGARSNAEAELRESRRQVSLLSASVHDVAVHGPQCPGCPPPPECPTPVTVQQGEIIRDCTLKLGEIRLRMDAKQRLFDEAIAAAKKAGVGPASRAWVTDDQAQLKAREVVLAYGELTGVAGEYANMSGLCLNRMRDTVDQLGQMQLYRDAQRRGSLSSVAYDEIDSLFPHWSQWYDLISKITRESVGCKDEPGDSGHGE